MALEPYRQLRQYRNDLNLMEYWGTAPPSATTDVGPFKVGDIVWNTAPSATPGVVLCWICTTAGADGSIAVFSPVEIGGINTAFNTAANTTGFTATAAQVSGGDTTVVLALTGTLGGGANIQMPTVAALVTALGGYVQAGQSYTLRIINESSANFAWTVTTNTGWTLTGTMTIAQNTWRDFAVTFTSSSAAVLQNIGAGTFS